VDPLPDDPLLEELPGLVPGAGLALGLLPALLALELASPAPGLLQATRRMSATSTTEKDTRADFTNSPPFRNSASDFYQTTLRGATAQGDNEQTA
jgi:hypothetical protein